MNLAAVRWMPLPHADDDRGTLTAIEASALPFEIKRIFYMHRVPEGRERGAHAHRFTRQIVIAVSGSLLIEVSDGVRSETFTLDDPNRGLFLPEMTWVRLHGFRAETVALVLCDRQYAPAHVVRDWDEYRDMARESPLTP
jgi:dTDP-4-dehydrorhamnose 3,5-epimerase-like enzyme